MAKQHWSEREVAASVEAYLEMLDAELNDRRYVKSHVNRRLREAALSSRSAASIEYRMQNISAVLEDLGLPRIKGYLPATNVGPSVRAQIIRILDDMQFVNAQDYEATTDDSELERRTESLRSRGLVKPPLGAKNPIRTVSECNVVARCPAVRAWILNNADGVCELCCERAPFTNTRGRPFFYTLSRYIPLEWHYLTTGSTTDSEVDGVLPKTATAPSFVDPNRALLSPQTNHQELVAHPNAIDALEDAFEEIGVAP